MAQQEKKMLKPKVMVVPEEAFCINSGMFKYDQSGNKIADYGAAMLNDNVLDVINTFENLMAGYGFQLTNLQQTLDELKEEAALNNVLKSKMTEVWWKTTLINCQELQGLISWLRFPLKYPCMGLNEGSNYACLPLTVHPRRL